MKRSLIVALTLIIFFFFVIWFAYLPTGEVIREVGEVGYVDISSSEAWMLMQENPDMIVLDVSPNYDLGHLPGAANYYIGDGSLDEVIPMLNPDRMYLVYCHFDSPSKEAAQKLVDAGFSKVYRLKDDYGGWVYSGYPIEY